MAVYKFCVVSINNNGIYDFDTAGLYITYEDALYAARACSMEEPNTVYAVLRLVDDFLFIPNEPTHTTYKGE